MATIFNKKARHDFIFYEKLEAGIALFGQEVKSVKEGAVSLADSYVRIAAGVPLLVNAYISPYKLAVDPSYEPRRERKLLLNKKEIDFLIGKTASSSLTIVPTKLYTKHNLAKLEIALARAKKKFDKREALKKKALTREVEAQLREVKLKAQQKTSH